MTAEIEKIMGEITAVAGAATQQPTSNRMLMCMECGTAKMWDLAQKVPDTCDHCKKVAQWVMGMSLPEVSHKRMLVKQNSEPKTPVTPDLVTPEGQPFMEPPKPESRTRKPRSVKVSAPANAPANAPVNQGAVTSPETTPDFKERRLQAIEAFKKSRHLNTLEYREVGIARVYSVGYTEWNDGKPSYTMFEDGVDNEVSFRRSLDEARKISGTVCVDVVQLTDIEPDDLLATLFNGQLFASKMGPRGPIKTPANCRVRVGAKVSKTGSLIFQVLGVL